MKYLALLIFSLSLMATIVYARQELSWGYFAIIDPDEYYRVELIASWKHYIIYYKAESAGIKIDDISVVLTPRKKLLGLEIWLVAYRGSEIIYEEKLAETGLESGSYSIILYIDYCKSDSIEIRASGMSIVVTPVAGPEKIYAIYGDSSRVELVESGVCGSVTPTLTQAPGSPQNSSNYWLLGLGAIGLGIVIALSMKRGGKYV